MKHIKNWLNINESKEITLDEYIKNQRDEIEDVFLDLIDSGIFDKYDDDEFEEENKTYFAISHDFEQVENFDSLEGLKYNMEIIKKKEKILEDIIVPLKRIEFLKYDWSVEIDENSINVIVFYKKKDYTLTDAFGGKTRMDYVNESIMKKVMKDDYNLDFFKSYYIAATSGYYGKNAETRLHFRGEITDNTFEKIRKDLSDLEKIDRQERITKPFKDYNIDLVRWEDQFMITIKMS